MVPARQECVMFIMTDTKTSADASQPQVFFASAKTMWESYLIQRRHKFNGSTST